MKRVVYWLLIILLSLIFLASAITVADYLIGSVKYKSQLSDLQQMHTMTETRPSVSLRQPTDGVTVPSDPTIPSDPTDPTDPENITRPTDPQPTDPKPTDPVIKPPDTTTPDKPVMLPELVGLYKMNKDLVGYVYIPDTNVNCPVVQRKSEKDYYLHRDFLKQETRHGCVYVREACDVFEPSDVVTLYGHNMADNTMFSHVHKFKKKDFFKSHPILYFDTLYERHTYQVVCVFRTSAKYGEGFPYHLYDDFNNKEEFDEFVKNARALAVQDSHISVHYGDKLLLLSTCEGAAGSDQRLVLMAVRID